MSRGRRLVLAVLSAAILMTASAAPVTVLALGETPVTLSCDDGTKIDLTVDAAALLGLKDVVEAMTLYPAGLSCGLNQGGVLGGALGPGVALAANGPKDFAVGGGQFTNYFLGCRENFAISAHVPAGTPVTPGTAQPEAGGTVNLSFPGTASPPSATCTAQGSLVTKVDCVQVVSNNHAKFTSLITKSTGFFATFAGGVFAEGNELAWDVKDMDPAPDQFVGQPTGSPCTFTAEANAATFSIDRGNIEVHNK